MAAEVHRRGEQLSVRSRRAGGQVLGPYEGQKVAAVAQALQRALELAALPEPQLTPLSGQGR